MGKFRIVSSCFAGLEPSSTFRSNPRQRYHHPRLEATRSTASDPQVATGGIHQSPMSSSHLQGSEQAHHNVHARHAHALESNNCKVTHDDEDDDEDSDSDEERNLRHAARSLRLPLDVVSSRFARCTTSQASKATLPATQEFSNREDSISSSGGWRTNATARNMHAPYTHAQPGDAHAKANDEHKHAHTAVAIGSNTKDRGISLRKSRSEVKRVHHRSPSSISDVQEDSHILQELVQSSTSLVWGSEVAVAEKASVEEGSKEEGSSSRRSFPVRSLMANASNSHATAATPAATTTAENTTSSSAQTAVGSCYVAIVSTSANAAGSNAIAAAEQPVVSAPQGDGRYIWPSGGHMPHMHAMNPMHATAALHQGPMMTAHIAQHEQHAQHSMDNALNVCYGTVTQHPRDVVVPANMHASHVLAPTHVHAYMGAFTDPGHVTNPNDSAARSAERMQPMHASPYPQNASYPQKVPKKKIPLPPQPLPADAQLLARMHSMHDSGAPLVATDRADSALQVTPLPTVQPFSAMHEPEASWERQPPPAPVKQTPAASTHAPHAHGNHVAQIPRAPSLQEPSRTFPQEVHQSPAPEKASKLADSNQDSMHNVWHLEALQPQDEQHAVQAQQGFTAAHQPLTSEHMEVVMKHVAPVKVPPPQGRGLQQSNPHPTHPTHPTPAPVAAPYSAPATRTVVVESRSDSDVNSQCEVHSVKIGSVANAARAAAAVSPFDTQVPLQAESFSVHEAHGVHASAQRSQCMPQTMQGHAHGRMHGAPPPPQPPPEPPSEAHAPFAQNVISNACVASESQQTQSGVNIADLLRTDTSSPLPIHAATANGGFPLMDSQQIHSDMGVSPTAPHMHVQPQRHRELRASALRTSHLLSPMVEEPSPVQLKVQKHLQVGSLVQRDQGQAVLFGAQPEAEQQHAFHAFHVPHALHQEDHQYLQLPLSSLPAPLEACSGSAPYEFEGELPYPPICDRDHVMHGNDESHKQACNGQDAGGHGNSKTQMLEDSVESAFTPANGTQHTMHAQMYNPHNQLHLNNGELVSENFQPGRALDAQMLLSAPLQSDQEGFGQAVQKTLGGDVLGDQRKSVQEWHQPEWGTEVDCGERSESKGRRQQLKLQQLLDTAYEGTEGPGDESESATRFTVTSPHTTEAQSVSVRQGTKSPSYPKPACETTFKSVSPSGAGCSESSLSGALKPHSATHSPNRSFEEAMHAAHACSARNSWDTKVRAASADGGVRAHMHELHDCNGGMLLRSSHSEFTPIAAAAEKTVEHMRSSSTHIPLQVHEAHAYTASQSGKNPNGIRDNGSRGKVPSPLNHALNAHALKSHSSSPVSAVSVPEDTSQAYNKVHSPLRTSPTRTSDVGHTLRNSYHASPGMHGVHASATHSSYSARSPLQQTSSHQSGSVSTHSINVTQSMNNISINEDGAKGHLNLHKGRHTEGGSCYNDYSSPSATEHLKPQVSTGAVSTGEVSIEQETAALSGQLAVLDSALSQVMVQLRGSQQGALIARGSPEALVTPLDAPNLSNLENLDQSDCRYSENSAVNARNAFRQKMRMSVAGSPLNTSAAGDMGDAPCMTSMQAEAAHAACAVRASLGEMPSPVDHASLQQPSADSRLHEYATNSGRLPPPMVHPSLCERSCIHSFCCYDWCLKVQDQ